LAVVLGLAVFAIVLAYAVLVLGMVVAQAVSAFGT
jgi:hypothetical protein